MFLYSIESSLTEGGLWHAELILYSYPALRMVIKMNVFK